MKLEYTVSLHQNPPPQPAGDLPFADLQGARVNVSLSGKTNGPFPPFFEVGKFILVDDPTTGESGIILRLKYPSGYVPGETRPSAVGKWVEVPKSLQKGHIRIALTHEAIRKIRRVSGAGEESRYELSLENVELFDVTGLESD
jgi:hypothetical protein